jgi:kumamolisin
MNARAAGAIDAGERIQVTIRVRRRSPLPAMDSLSAARPTDRRPMTHEEFDANHGADPADLARIEDFASDHGLTVVESSIPRRCVIVAGRLDSIRSAFNVELRRYEYDGGSYRGREGEVHVPADIAPLVEGVFGLDDRPQAQAHFQWSAESAPQGAEGHTAAMPKTKPSSGRKGGRKDKEAEGAPAGAEGFARAHAMTSETTPKNPQNGFNPNDVGKLYNFPNGVNGTGQCIAIIELGGGFRRSDITSYFHSLGLSRPTVTAVSVDGAHNHPTTPNGPDGEVALDIEVAGAVAPGAKLAVYFAPNTDQGFLNAITAAIHDKARKPSVISISWGAAEPRWTQQAMDSMDQAFQSAAALGITVCVASGDNGSSDGMGDGRNHVDFPASSPFALGCGGTRLETTGQNTISSETVWNDNPTSSATGGGVSAHFPRPSWQQNVHANGGMMGGRGAPDLSGDADPVTGYRVLVDGQQGIIGGTSAVAPLLAGLIALINQKLNHRVGYLNPAIYTLLSGTGAFVDITSGNNGGFQAKPGWDACTGWGRPNGATMAAHL